MLGTTTTGPQATVGPRAGGLALTSGSYAYPRPLNSSSREAQIFDRHILTALVVASQDAQQNGNYALFRGLGSSAPAWGIGRHTGTLNGAVARIGTYGIAGSAAAQQKLGEARVVALTGDGANAVVYLDGEVFSSGTYTPVAFQYSAGRQVFFGTVNGQGNEQTVRPSVGFVWDHALSADEIKAITANPYQLFLATEEDLDSAFSVAPAGYTLGAGVGAFAVSGGSANLRADRGLVALSATYIVSGSPATLAAARKIAANVGAFAIAGGTTTLRSSHRLGAPAGAFALSGNLTAVRAMRQLAGAAGTLTLAGSATALNYAPVITPGAYTLTAGARTFRVAGSVANLLVARKVQGDGGTFEIDGAPARLACGRRWTISARAFVLAGRDPSLCAAYRLQGVSGAFTVTGNLATLRLGAEIIYARAPVGGGYTPRRNESQSRPAQTSGTRPAAIQRNHR